MTDPRYEILFTPLQIGPHLAKNRFYQVPHCNGGGYRDPSAAAEMRRTKAEGGWGVIFTEQTEIHQTSEITPFIELRLWEDQDIPAIAKMAERMKSHGALAGIQLAYSGVNGPNLYTKEVPLAVSPGPIRTFTYDPVQARGLDKTDIRNLRRWFVNAAKRSKMAGFDLLCLYGAHGFGIFQHFLSRATNQRGDEYGGSLENRSRFAREVMADLRDAVGDTMAFTMRVSLDETIGDLGFSNAELRDFIEMNGDLPDGTIKVLVEGLSRVAVEKIHEHEGSLQGSAVELHADESREPREIEAIARSLMSLFEQYVKTNRKLPPELMHK